MYLVVDAGGAAYVVGGTESPDFPTTPGAFQTIYGGDGDAHVIKLNPTGSGLVYATFLGGNWQDVAFGITVDDDGIAYVTGFTYSTNFPITAAAFQTICRSCPGYSDGFVTKLNPMGSSLVYSGFLGGNSYDWGSGIVIDASGAAYLVGPTRSTDFPVTPGAFQVTYGGGLYDGFMTKLNQTASQLIYSTYLGASGYEGSSRVAADSSDSA